MQSVRLIPEQVLKMNSYMTRPIFIFMLLLFVNQQITAQVKFDFYNSKGKKLTLSVVKADSVFCHFSLNKNLDVGIDSLFTYLDFFVDGDTLFYKSVLDKTNKKDLFLTTQPLERTLVSYTKKNYLIPIEGETIAYIDAPNEKNVIACTAMKVFIGEYKFSICDKLFPVYYFNIESQYFKNFVIGFVPNIGIVALGYSFSLKKGEPITEIYYLECSSLEEMRAIWRK